MLTFQAGRVQGLGFRVQGTGIKSSSRWSTSRGSRESSNSNRDKHDGGEAAGSYHSRNWAKSCSCHSGV